MELLMVLFVISVLFGNSTELQRDTNTWGCNGTVPCVDELVRHWAPLVWLAPGERYFPSGVSDFLQHVIPRRNRAQPSSEIIPEGQSSENWYLVTKQSVDSLLRDSTSFLHGTNPVLTSVPVYALVSPCSNSTIVTYWMFYPYSQGKPLCMVDTSLFGTWLFPAIYRQCLGTVREYGGHVGDWEHVSLEFRGRGPPAAMYVSTHELGAYYRYSAASGSFDYERQGVLQRPAFPAGANVTSVGGHPILFAARGSHGLWTAPGRHWYVKAAGLYDVTGYGVPWPTWKHVQVIHDSEMFPAWMRFRGRWGNPKSMCHPVARLALSACQYSDGPTGIPMKKRHFKCSTD